MAGQLLQAGGANGKPWACRMAPSKRSASRDFRVTCYVYILRLRNNQLYVGSTENLVRRLAEHQAGTACRTTALLRPVELIYSESHPDRSSAVKRERQLKRWSHAKKFALITGDWTELKRLARPHNGTRE